MSLSRAEAQEALQTRMCPWCNKGPFASLASHTQMAHEVRANDLRRMAGLSRYESVASPELSAAAAERGRERPHLKGHEAKGGNSYHSGYNAMLALAMEAVVSARTGEPVERDRIESHISDLHELHPARVEWERR